MGFFYAYYNTMNDERMSIARNELLRK